MSERLRGRRTQDHPAYPSRTKDPLVAVSESVAIYQWREPAVSASWLDSSCDDPREHLERLAKLPGVETRIVYTHPAKPEGARKRVAELLVRWFHPNMFDVVTGKSPLPGQHTKDGCMTCEFFAEEIIVALASQPAATEREHFHCSNCGVVKADEDGCCASCGRDVSMRPAATEKSGDWRLAGGAAPRSPDDDVSPEEAIRRLRGHEPTEPTESNDG